MNDLLNKDRCLCNLDSNNQYHECNFMKNSLKKMFLTLKNNLWTYIRNYILHYNQQIQAKGIVVSLGVGRHLFTKPKFYKHAYF